MLTFANPVFLFSLLGLAIPILVHLVSRDHAVLLRFPSIRFINKSSLPKEGRRRVSDLLLLLMRLLFLLFLLSSFASPQWEAALTEEEDVEKTVFVVDLSSSMSGWGSRERALDGLKSELDALSEQSYASIVLFSDKVLYSSELTLEHDRLLSAFEASSSELRVGRPEKAIEKASAILGEKGLRRIVVISDFQQSDWDIEQWPALSPSVGVEFLPVGKFDEGNLAILSARAYPMGEGKTRVIARVKNFSQETKELNLVLKTQSDEESQLLTVAPRQTQRLAFLINTPENFVGELSLEDASYQADNSYVVWMGGAPPIKMLIIAGLEKDQSKLQEIKFVTKALEVSTEAAFNRYAMGLVDLDQDLSLLNDGFSIAYLPGSISQFNDAQLGVLKGFIEKGGIALITPDKNAAKQSRALSQAGISESEYIGKPRSMADRRQAYHIAWLNPETVLSEIFNEESADDLYMADIYRYSRMRPMQGAEIFLKLENDDPLLWREYLGEGSLIQTAVSWDIRSSDLPLRSSFLPLLRELLDVDISDTAIVRIECGESLSDSDLPKGLSAGDTSLIGLSESPAAFVLGDKIYEVNVARSESLPESIMLTDLKANMYTGVDGGREGVSAKGASLHSLWLYFLGAAFLFLLLESLLTYYFSTKMKN